MSKTPEQHLDTSETKFNQPHLQKIKLGVSKKNIINPNKFVLIVFVYQTIASLKPQVRFKKGRRNSQRDNN